ncbi:MAG: AbrB family transcriptional regulator [Actinobacteria bacterium]|nr:AbrB family transcriptional regulator [Actinomycetota bacterium]
MDILLKSRESKDEGEQEDKEQEEGEQESAGKTGYLEKLRDLGVAAPWTVLGSVIGLVSGVPAGGIVGALVASAAFELLTGRSMPLARFRIGVQILGGVIGFGVSSSLLGEFGRLALVSTPGGISGVIPAAEETDADAVIVTFMHLVRLSTVVVVVPILVTVFFGR